MKVLYIGGSPCAWDAVSIAFTTSEYVAPFDGDLDDYPVWLRERELETTETGGTAPTGPLGNRTGGKKQNRQAEARKRQQLKPFSDKVRTLERQMASHRENLAAVEETLHEESLYTDESRKAEMTTLMQKRAELKEALDTLEWDWLEASEALESARNELP